MKKATAYLLFVLAFALCMPCIAFAATSDLQAGTAAVDAQGSEGAPGKAALSKFKSGAAGKMYAQAAKEDTAAGYKFQVALDKRFKVGLKEKTIKGNAATFTGLTGKKRYYGRVRAFSVVDGKTVWGPWSEVGSSKVTQALIGVAMGGSYGSARSWIERGGAKAVKITSLKVNPAKYDGLVLPGGGDVNPKLYGAKKHSRTYGISATLDKLQIGLVRKFSKAGKPVIGLCRGNQVINVAFGGSLYQHIKGWHKGSRTVKIKKGSWLYGIFGSSEKTSHYHHQCVLRLGKGLVATQWDAKDKRIEAIEHESLPVYGLQWHPEGMGARGTKVAKKFLRVCSKYSTPRK